jgi:hypothetical protein
MEYAPLVFILVMFILFVLAASMNGEPNPYQYIPDVPDSDYRGYGGRFNK